MIDLTDTPAVFLYEMTQTILESAKTEDSRVLGIDKNQKLLGFSVHL